MASCFHNATLEELSMKFTLPRFGLEEVEIDPDTIIEFPVGIPGFENCRRFKLFHREGKNPSVFWLQSLDDPGVVFSLADPDSLKISYELTLDDDEQRTLRISPNDDLRIAIMLSRQMEEEGTARGSIRANMQAPIAINVTKRVALQKSLMDAEISIRA